MSFQVCPWMSRQGSNSRKASNRKVGVMGRIRIEDIRGAELSYMILGKKDLIKILDGHPAVTQKQAQAIWSWYSGHCDKIDAQSRINTASVTAEFVKAMGFSQDGWQNFASSIGLDHDTTIGVYSDFTGIAEEVGQEIAAQKAKADEKAKAEAEAEGDEDADQPEARELSDETLDQVIADIRKSPAYWDDKAPIQDHERAVKALNKAMEMRAGVIPRTMEAVGEYAREFKSEKEQIAKEQYGIQGGSVYKTGDFKSSNGISTDQSWKGEDTGKDGLANSGDTGGEGEVDDAI